MRTSSFLFAIAAAAVLFNGVAAAQTGPMFFGVGDLPGGAFASLAYAEGGSNFAHVVGESQTADGWRAFRWTQASGIQSLGTLVPTDQFSAAFDIAQHNGTIVGSSGFAPSPYEAQAFRTTGAGLQTLGPFAGGGAPGLAQGISWEGGVIVGQAGASPGGPRAFRWTPATGAVGLGSLPGGSPDNSAATAVDSGGDMIVGYAQDASLNTQAFRWTPAGGMVGLGFLNATGFKDSRAWALSETNTAFTPAVVGESTSPNGPHEAFLWRPASGMVGLGDLPGGEFRSVALATSYVGGEVFGWSDTPGGPRAFVWDATSGMRDLKTVLESLGFNVTGWTLLRANSCSLGGGIIVGDGINPLGQPEGWVALRACYADCNADGGITVADFGCFQTRFVLGEPYGDCNGDGSLTVADFGCFRNKVVLGCG